MSDNPSSLPSPFTPPTGGNRSIGELIREAKNLTPEQMDSVLKYQAEHGIRFGDAAVALGRASLLAKWQARCGLNQAPA